MSISKSTKCLTSGSVELSNLRCIDREDRFKHQWKELSFHEREAAAARHQHQRSNASRDDERASLHVVDSHKYAEESVRRSPFLRREVRLKLGDLLDKVGDARHDKRVVRRGTSLREVIPGVLRAG